MVLTGYPACSLMGKSAADVASTRTMSYTLHNEFEEAFAELVG